MKAVIYSRVSTDEQAREGISLEAQEERCRELVRETGGIAVGVCRDAGVSASTIDRPGLNDALAVIERGQADTLVVAALDRLCRTDMRDFTDLMDRLNSFGAGLLFVKDRVSVETAADRLQLGMRLQVSTYEREIAGERTAEILRRHRAKGLHVGRPPFGWRTGKVAGTLEPDASEQQAIVEARRMRRKGWSYQRIADSIDILGGKHPMQITRVLKAPLASEMVSMGDGLFKHPTA